MSENPTTTKTRIITLTDRRPVRIREDEWPEIASSTSDSWDGPVDPGRHSQAMARGELDRYSLRVRQHNDGRVLVYGVVAPGITTRGQEPDRRGGELLNPGADIIGAIRRVGGNLAIPDHISHACIADLPPEDL